MTLTQKPTAELLPSAYTESTAPAWRRRSLLAGIGSLGLLATTPGLAATLSFPAWLAAFRREAAASGIAETTLRRALDGISPVNRVLELDRRQPEFMQSFWRYMRRVNDRRIAEGQQLQSANNRILSKVEAESGVPAPVLMSFWGLETNFGGYLGDFQVIPAVATLAWDGRREALFRGELLAALRIVQSGVRTERDLIGSWAGATGQFQFLPSTYLRNAVDEDGTGVPDIWSSLPDAFASAANLLRNNGWRVGEPWGYEVTLPNGFNYALADGKTARPLTDWQDLGVRRPGGVGLTPASDSGALVLPAGWQGPAFLVFSNYRAIRRWNNSELYALSVGILSDRIAGFGPLSKGPPADADQRLTLQEVRQMQSRLNALGYDSGIPDGKVGPMTKGAIRAYQVDRGLPADGYPTAALLRQILN
ncbi:MAG: lytic murein transglycosylase [Pseudomonadota bacterium]